MKDMKLDILFDVLCHRQAHPEENFNYKNTSLSPRQQTQYIQKQVQAFIHRTGQLHGEKIIQAFTGSSDLPEMTKDVFNVTNQVPNYDILWQDAFKTVTLQKGELSWEIATVSSGLEFKEIPEGGKVEFEKWEASKIIASVTKYGLGTGVTWETIEGRKLYKFIDQIEFVRSALYTRWATIHYSLLAASGLADTSTQAQAEGFAADFLRVAYQGAATDATLDRDVATINKMYERIGEVTKDRGYGDTANAQMLIYASPNLKARIQQALKTTNIGVQPTKTSSGAGSQAGQAILYNVEPRYTWNENIPANKFIMVLPGNKVQNSVYLRELQLGKTDMESLNELKSYWTVFGAVIADNDQVGQGDMA